MPGEFARQGRAKRDVLVFRFDANASASVTETQCGRAMTHVDLTPREAALFFGLFKPENYEAEARDQACTDGGGSFFEMITQGQAALVGFRCAAPMTVATLVGDFRKMMVKQYNN